MHVRTAVWLAFLSGFVALGYEILWARRLADAIGATALAAGLVVGTFFVMLAAGAIVLGPHASRSRSPWTLYAVLEAGILLAILPAFFGDTLTTALARALGDALFRPGVGLAMKALVALLFVGGASFCMGGTMPALAQAVVRADRLGREGNLLYGANTLGGAFGIVVTTFALAPALGMHRSFLVLMLGSTALALVAWRIGRRSGAAPAASATPIDSPAASEPTAAPASGSPAAPALTSPGSPAAALSSAGPPASLGARAWLALAFVSGFSVLGLEILAIHLFGQVLHNSTYTFATVLVVVIAALAVGALVVQRLRLDAGAATAGLALVLLLGAAATALVPRGFFAATNGLQPFGGGVASLGGYVLRITGIGTLVLGPVFVLAGWVFPLVLAGAGAARAPAAGERTLGVGTRWGRLLGANAAGALLGLAVADFVALPALGLWMSFTVWSVVAFATGAVLAPRTGASRAARARLASAAGLAVVALVAAFPSRLPVAALRPGDTLLGWRAGADGIAAVIALAPEGPGEAPNRRIKLNNTYSLGGTGNAAQQGRMGLLPLLLHPEPRRTGFIGVATGITAAAALRDPAVRRVAAVELSPEITALACAHFADANADLCRDPRARVVVEDGRLFFRATRDTFDVVVGDLFVPWQAGTANLYTREHFEAVRAHLAPGGLFAQWLPLFQLDPVGYFGIAATFAAVFPNAWIAVSDFQPYNPALALIGWRDTNGAPAAEVLSARCAEVRPLARLREPMLADVAGAGAFLVGPAARVLPPGGTPLLTLDRPWLADHAPRVQREQPERWFVGAPLAAYLQRVAGEVRPDDPLAPHVQLGQRLYRFAEIVEREGIERAAAWYDANVTERLPPTNFAIARPERMSWPFAMQTGLFLVRRALQETTRGRAGRATP